MKDMREKNDQVAHWEAQIAEIIQWYLKKALLQLLSCQTKSL